MTSRGMMAWLVAALLLFASSNAVVADESAEGAIDTAEPASTSPPSVGSLASALVGYTEAVRLRLEGDPALAAAYLAFWQGLTEARDPAALDESGAGALLSRSEAVLRAVRQRYPEGSSGYRLADTLALATGVLAADGARRPEILLASVDRLVAPRLQVNGRYEYAGSLRGPADLGMGADLWLRCRQSLACAAAHDSLFGESLGGVALDAGLDERLEQDETLRSRPDQSRWLAAIAMLEQQLRESPMSLRDAAVTAAGAYWQVIGASLNPAAAAGSTSDAASPAAADLPILLSLGRATAWLAGTEPLANSYSVAGPPLLEYSRLALQGGGGFLAATAGVGLLFAGVQALALFDSDAAAPRELSRLVNDLHASTYRNFVGLRADALLASNAIDARLVRMGLTLDVIRDDVARIETAQRARTRADYLVQDARRWTAFEQDNDRCFSLRSLDPKTGRLRPADFRRCEDRFLQGAVRRSQYLNRAQDFLLDARYLEPADLRFPFHHHYPLLLTQAGMDTRTALALPDPFDWQQHAAALMRLYQDNPAAPADYTRRAEALRALRAPGARIHDALDALVLERGAAQPAFRADLHRQTLNAYFEALRALAARVDQLDAAAADRFGKRLTEGLNQPLPAGSRLDAIEAVLAGAQQGDTALKPCGDAAADEFVTPESGLSAESRRFFASPITTAELARSWNRDAIAGFDLQPASRAALVPRPFLWAALDDHGEIDICLARFQPTAVEFTRDEALLRNHLQARATLDARIEVRFTPSEALVQEIGLGSAWPPIVVASYQATRECSFAYRNDNEGCSRGQCLAQLAPEFWAADDRTAVNGGSCQDESLPQQLARRNDMEGASELLDFAAALESPYWAARAVQRAQLLAEATRTREYETASALYLQYFALAGTTLGTWPDPTEPLAPLFADTDALTPRAVLQRLLDERIPPVQLESAFATVQGEVLEKITARGRELAASDAVHRLPQMHALQETLSRIDILLAGYTASR